VNRNKQYPSGYTFRATDEDHKAMAAVAEHLRQAGKGWATKSDAMRYAIHAAAQMIAAGTPLPH
jgi:hypothetical protein